VPYIPGTFIVNVGDVLSRWTNDVFNSTPHRVISPASDKDRYSIGYFFDPSLSTEIRTLPVFAKEEAGARYRPVQYSAYFSGRLDANYQDRGSA